jgi:predicted RNA-binding Zn ribbon-like protein
MPEDLPEAAIELAATIRGGGDAVRDSLSSPADLERWLLRHPELGGPTAELALRLGDFRALRDSVRTALQVAAESRPLPPDAVRILNEASGAVPQVLHLDASNGSPRADRAGRGGSRAAEVLASIARSAIVLLGGSDRERLRVCPALRCGQVFLASRPRQVWCSAACGNRTRVARHHARRAAAG